MRRVVITGMAGFSPIGNDWQTISKNLRCGNTGIRYMDLIKNWKHGLVHLLRISKHRSTIPANRFEVWVELP